MAGGIPKVKTWRVTLETGQVLHVLAPTRRLAVLNTRHAGYYAAIEKIGVMRDRGQHVTVLEEVR